MSKYLPYHAPSRALARDLCKGKSSALDKWHEVTEWVSTSIGYDYARAITIPKVNGTPDLERCWRLRCGICLDTASLTVGMLREVGVTAYLVFGWADKKYHAWTEATINGKTYRFDRDDPFHKVRQYKKEWCFG